MIKDEKLLITGSSNITEASMSESGHLLDCNIITKDKKSVKTAEYLFKSLKENKDYLKNIEKSRFMYSRNSEDYLPFSLKPYFEKENEEITLLFSCNMVDKRIIDRIIEWNSTTPIKLYVSDSWDGSKLTQNNLNSMKWLYDASINGYKSISVIPTKSNVHTKLYMFKSQKNAIISSQNLTVESWQSLLETGLVTEDKKDFRYLYDSINSLKKSQLTNIEIIDLEETDKPESLFSGTETERSISVPWELPEADRSWRIPRIRNPTYYKLVKHKLKQKDETLEYIGKRDDSKEIKKDLLSEKLNRDYLYKEGITGRYSAPSRYVVTGKTSRKRTILELKWQQEKLEKQLEIEPDEGKRKKILKGINFCKEKLGRLDE